MTAFSQKSSSNFLETTQLAKFKSMAMRAGVWFRDLSRIDRVLIDLTIKVARNVRSASLAKCILSVTGKLEGLLENRLVRAMREVGYPLACKLCSVAQKWGNRGALEWAKDLGFVRYLAAMQLNGNALGNGLT